MGCSLSRGFGSATHLFSFIGFFVRSHSRFFVPTRGLLPTAWSVERRWWRSLVGAVGGGQSFCKTDAGVARWIAFAPPQLAVSVLRVEFGRLEGDGAPQRCIRAALARGQGLES